MANFVAKAVAALVALKNVKGGKGRTGEYLESQAIKDKLLYPSSRIFSRSLNSIFPPSKTTSGFIGHLGRKLVDVLL